MSSLTNIGRWLLWSLAPAFLLAWVFSGCGKDATIHITKNESAYGVKGTAPSAETRRVRVELKWDAPGAATSGGVIKLLDGTIVVDQPTDKDVILPKGKSLTLVAEPARGWSVDHWDIFPGTTRNQTQTSKAKEMQIDSLTDDQYVTVVFKPKQTVEFKVRVEGPPYDGGRNSYTGFVKWKIVKRPDNKYDQNWYGQCHVWGNHQSQVCTVTYLRGTTLELDIVHRGGETEKKQVTLDDDTYLQFAFSEKN